MKHNKFYLTKSEIDTVLRALERAIPHIADQLAHTPRTQLHADGRAYLEDQLRDMKSLKLTMYEFLIKR